MNNRFFFWRFGYQHEKRIKKATVSSSGPDKWVDRGKQSKESFSSNINGGVFKMIWFVMGNCSNYRSKINYRQFPHMNLNDQVEQFKEAQCKEVTDEPW